MAASAGGTAADAADADVAFEPEEREAIARLGAQDVERIDAAILAALDREWRKAGFITAGLVIAAPDAYEEIPEMFYALRIRTLARMSRIEVSGDPLALKTSEIRLATDPDAG